MYCRNGGFKLVTTMIKIRQAVRDDAEKIVDISRRSWRLNILNQSIGLTSEMVDARFKNLDSVIQGWQNSILSQDENNFVLIAEIDSVVVGFCRCGKLEQIGEIRAMYVDPNFVRKSIGRLLMTEALKKLSCCKKVIVRVANYNQGAIDFYQSQGFKKNKVLVNPVRITGDVEIPHIEMEKFIY